jgi:hypothetical protein
MRRTLALEATWREGGLPWLISEAKAVGGEPLAEHAVKELLATVCSSAVSALGRARARELIERQLTALEKSDRVKLRPPADG